VVISDIDDTVVQTGIANKLLMMWRLFVEEARSRLAFPGVATLYRALHGGVSGHDGNPMLYVSRAPWGTYDVLEEFFHIHAIPVGPVLFLREWGVTWTSPLPRKAEEHKEDLINRMLALYRDLPFVLIGDSGQHDPEIYSRIVERHPGRVLAVFIRDVSRDPARIEDIERLAVAVSAAGSSLVLAADSVAMAEQAARLGLVPQDTPHLVRCDRAVEASPAEPEPAATGRLSRSTPGATARAVEGGELKALLEDKPGTGEANVVVEAATDVSGADRATGPTPVQSKTGGAPGN
jgi:phosphatidate phosphatase APP1